MFTACSSDNPITPDTIRMREVEAAMTTFVESLQQSFPDDVQVSNRIAAYLERHPSYFYGSTIAVINPDSSVRLSPYWYRSGTSLAFANLAVASYQIRTKSWFTEPIAKRAAVWTEPYFDAGGGEIWMRTYSVPVIINGTIVAIATTDLAVTP
jgi:sigma-B regulation protein RsbU (phosphoserine phosphatase)